MKRIIILIGGVAVVSLVVVFFTQKPQTQQPTIPITQSTTTIAAVTVVAENLEIPWDIAFLPDGSMLVTERTGHLVIIAPDGAKKEIAVPSVKKTGEGGLLGLELHPDFESNHFLYLYMSTPGTNGQTQNKAVRYRFTDGTLVEDTVIISGIPGAVYHDGGRMAFGPDGMLYITTGDATTENIAQTISSLGGKILRLHDDGTIPADNPFNTAVYSYGHRNPQGLAWDSAGRLWETEHGRSGIRSGLDEINLIQAGANYGWPIIEGNEMRTNMVSPILNSGTTTTWAPASAAIVGNSLFFGGLAGEALYEAVLDGKHITELKIHFRKEFGRIRTVRVGPDGMLYLTTSNRDGRGESTAGDDKIIRIDPALLRRTDK